MTTRNRQGRRMLIVLPRLAVATVLSITGLPVLPETGPLFAQTGLPLGAQPPPSAERFPRHPALPTSAAALEIAEPTPLPDPANSVPGRPPAAPTPPVPVLAALSEAPGLIALPTPPSLERLTAQRNSLNQILYRDRRHQLLLSRGDEALAAGNAEVALAHFQALMDAQQDAFFWPQDSLQPRGAQYSARGRLTSLPVALREDCERRHGDEARALLRDAVSQGEEHLLRDVLRRFPHTAAGRDALVRELSFAFDSGRHVFAVDLARRLASDRYHWDRLPPHVQALVRRLIDSGPPATDVAAALRASASVSVPALRPLWWASLDQTLTEAGEPAGAPEKRLDVAQAVDACIEEWLQERQERRLPVSTACQPLLAGNLLVVRDFSGVRALDVTTGRVLWTCACFGSLAATARANLHEEARGGGAPPISFHTHFAGHGPRAQMTTDGHRLYLIDDESPTPVPRAEHATRERTRANRLVALPLHPPVSKTQASPVEQHPDWVRGRQETTAFDGVDGRFFLGAPLAIDGRLFVLAESDGRIECLSLRAADGSLLWRQPIALVEQSVEDDVSRQHIACTPLSAGSVIVCPTQIGLVVGVDSLTGVLRWAYDSLDDDQRSCAGRWCASAQRGFGSCELPSRTLLYDGKVYHLPLRSRFVHCIDAATGALVWKSDRDDALALTAATDAAVLLIGPRDVQALSRTDGTPLWKTTSPEPAGHGVIAGDQYLLPTIEGSCLAIALQGGSPSGSRFAQLLRELSQPIPRSVPSGQPQVRLAAYREAPARPSAPPAAVAAGNLLVAGDCIVVAGPRQLAVFPQARSLLEQLQSEFDENGTDERRRFQLALLHLQLGEIGHARRTLESLAASRTVADDPRVPRLLREILFVELASASDPRPILDQLAALPGDETDHLRLLVCRIEAELALEDPQGLIAALQQFRQLTVRMTITPAGADAPRVRAEDHVADLLAAARTTASAELSAALNSYLNSAVAAARASADFTAQERLISLFADWPQVSQLRNTVAEGLIAAGNLQQAELLLLRNQESTPHGAAARATRLLAELYASEQLHHAAAVQLLSLAGEYRDADVGDRQSGREFTSRFPREHPAWDIVRRRCAAALPAYHVRIAEHLCDETCDEATCRAAAALQYHDRIRRKFLPGDRASVTVIDRGLVTANRNQSRLTLINRETGRFHGEFDVSAAYWQLAGAGEGCCGHVLPICGRTAQGLSLLEKRCLWSTGEDADDRVREKVKVGPIGPDYCVLQTTRQLSVVHPATGEIHWVRENLPPGVGLMTNETTGIIGDGQTLTLFDADQLSYTVYRMRSGRKIRTGRLDVAPAEARRHRRGVGACLVHLVSDETSDRLRIWDASEDRMLLDERLRDRLFCAIGDGSRYAFITSDGRFTVADVRSGKIELDAPLDEPALLDASELNVTSDPSGYLVNLVGCPTETSEDVVAATDEVELPHLRVQGTLLAFSRGGRLLWSTPVADAALLTHSDFSLPVVTLISRVRDPQQRQSALLRIDVRDVKSGEILARRDDLVRTRFVQADYQLQPGRLTLVGLDSRIDINFAPPLPLPESLIHAEVQETEQVLAR